MTSLSKSLIPRLLQKSAHSKVSLNLFAVLSGVLILSMAARISIPLPFTPVPITGQTFGVTLIALLWGRHRGFLAVGSYLALGFSGLPFFAFGQSGMTLGPTSGYLLGMLAASYIVGTLADNGWTKSFFKTYLASALGSFITFLFGVVVLSLFVPVEKVFALGVLPFLPGDFIKTLLACSLVRQISKSRDE